MCSRWATSSNDTVTANIIDYYVLRTLYACFLQGTVEVDPKMAKRGARWGEESQSNGGSILVSWAVVTKIP